MEKSQNKLKLFENKKIRYVWNDEEEDWYFSVVDIVEVLAESKDYQTARNYWKVLKTRLKSEGSELVTNCNRLKLQASDGKMRETDCLSTKNVLRLIQSIPSPKAEPFKMWLAQLGNDRLEEYADPEKAIIRGADYYRAKGYTEVTATSISKQEQPQSFEENKNVAVRGGKVADTAKKEYEKATGLKAVSSLNAKDKKALEIQNDKKE